MPIEKRMTGKGCFVVSPPVPLCTWLWEWETSLQLCPTAHSPFLSLAMYCEMKYLMLTWKGTCFNHRLTAILTAINHGDFYTPIPQTPLTPLHWDYKQKMQPVWSLSLQTGQKKNSRKAGWACAEEPWRCPQGHAFKRPWILASSTVTLCPVFQMLLHIKRSLAVGRVSVLWLLFPPWV